MSAARRKSLSVVYNGVEIWNELSASLESFEYQDPVDESDSISFTLSDRDLNWSRMWAPRKGDRILPSIITENWNYEGERMTVACGSFVVDDFCFSSPPLKGSVNGVSAPVDTSFKETSKTRTWEAATVRVIAQEIAGQYGLSLVYDCTGDIPVSKTEQSGQTDSDFLNSLCGRYGLGLKIYANRMVIFDFEMYYARNPVLTVTPDMVSKWSYRSTMQGTYTGAKVSYTNPGTRKTVEVLVGTEERLYRTTQKADSEADARLIGAAAIRSANRKETVMQITLPPKFSLSATNTVLLSGFGIMDGKYFIEQVSHSISRKAYSMQVKLSRVPETGQGGAAGTAEPETGDIGGTYVVQKGDTLWDLAQEWYGDPTKYGMIYEANAAAIEAAAKQRGKPSSNHGYWIFPGLVLKRP